MRWLLFSTLIVWLIALWHLRNLLRVKGVLGAIRQLVSLAIWGGAGACLTAVILVLHLFQAFSGETLAATVTTRRVSPEEFELVYAPQGEPQPLPPIRLRGDQWSVSGGIIKWHPWLLVTGVRSYHRPMRLSGQFSDLERQRTIPPTVHALAPAADRFWEAVYWMGPSLPFVEAVYGSAAYAYVEPGRVQEVYVSPSGYLIKRAPNR